MTPHNDIAAWKRIVNAHVTGLEVHHGALRSKGMLPLASLAQMKDEMLVWQDLWRFLNTLDQRVKKRRA